MFLPQYYHDDPKQYVQDAEKCLQAYKWIFNFQITSFFGSRVWEKLPVEWRRPLLELTTEELNELPYQFCKDEWPDSLKSFLRDAHRLSLTRKRCEEYPIVEINKAIKRGMIPKKIAEVSSMAAVVEAVCAKRRCEGVVDVGAGLGYLGQVLSHQLGHDVIGLELKDNHTKGAVLRQSKQIAGAGTELKLYTMAIKDDLESRKNLRKILREETKSQSNISDSYCSGCSCGDVTEKCKTNSSGKINNRLTGSHTGKKFDRGDTIEKDVMSPNLDFCGARKHFAQENSNDRKKKNLSSNIRACGSNSRIAPSCSNLGEKGTSDLSDVTSDVHCVECKFQTMHFLQSDGIESKVAQDIGDSAGSDLSDMTRDCHCVACKSHTTTSLLCDTIKADRSSQNHADHAIGTSFCMIGLHCCGDLTPTMLKLFVDIEEFSTLVCVSCCYHNMERNDEDDFGNFPMSRDVAEVLSGADPWWNHYAFRLAAQETRARWKNQTTEEHEHHTRHVAYRGILQEFVEKGDTTLKKIRRKVARKSAFDNFNCYLDAVLERTEGVDVSHQRQELLEVYDEYEDYFKYIELITALQVILQPVIESLITVDRVLYLKERSIEAEIVPIFDEFISPRNLAIIAKKTLGSGNS